LSKDRHGLGISCLPSAGEGNQCATITARGATIAAAPAWLAQNAAIAGVAVLAIAESSSTAVGMYALYFDFVR
jgi:hypothetical protein